MKITQIMLSKGFGGAERYFVELAIALHKSGHEIQVIHHKNFVGKNKFYNHDLQREEINLLGKWDLYGGYRIKKKIKSFAPQIIHAHLARATHIVGRTSAALDIPLVVKTHNYVNLKYYNHVNTFITTTRDQKDYLEKNNISSEKIQVIPNFSSIVPVKEVPDKKNKSYTIVTYGRMVYKKGFDILLSAFKNILDAGIDAELLIGGDGPEKKNLIRQSLDMGINNKVKFTGWIEDVESILKEADIFVLPSRNEPFGIAILEAMAMGVPIISTETRGPVEILDGQSAILVKTNDIESLTRGITDALINYHESLSRAIHALRLFNEKYEKNVVVNEILNLYRKLL